MNLYKYDFRPSKRKPQMVICDYCHKKYEEEEGLHDCIGNVKRVCSLACANAMNGQDSEAEGRFGQIPERCK